MRNLSIKSLTILGLLALLGLAHLLVYEPSEPFFNNDETRHVMTGVFFRDLLLDFPSQSWRHYTVNYYLQYPALGLLVWPPLFYLVEGMLMALLGTAFTVSKALIGLFTALACIYLFQLVRRTHDAPTAALTVLVFGLSPLVFTFSRQVMLEIPTLAFALAALYHAVRYLDLQKRHDLFLVALASAFAALTRFDAIYLLPLLGILLLVKRRLRLVWQKDALLSLGLALLLVLPFYAVTAKEFGWVHFKTVSDTMAPGYSDFLAPQNFVYYPMRLPQQIGWFALLPAVVGLVSSMRATRRHQAWPYLSLIAATYLTFTPIAELDSRHTIAWVPAFSLLAADGVFRISGWLRVKRLSVGLAILVLTGTAWTTLSRPTPFLRGYEQAARYVVAHTRTTNFCLFDGYLEGNFIYQMRRHDPARRLWTLRGDKLLYSSLIFPGVNYTEFARNQDDILAILFEHDPELIVVEEPGEALPMATLLRTVLADHPERFRLETVIPIVSNQPRFRTMRLEIYRNLRRNENPAPHLKIEMLGLRRAIQTKVPPPKSGYAVRQTP